MRILFARKFEKSLDKLPADIREQYYTRLVIFGENRRHSLLNDHALTAEWAGHRSINVTGDYRAVYWEVVQDTFEFVAIGTHHQLFGK